MLEALQMPPTPPPSDRVCPRCWAPADPDGRCGLHGLAGVMDRQGEVFASRFVAERLIGVGSFQTTVWQARDLQTDEEVALKVSPALNLAAVERTIHGTHVSLRLDHRNIARVIEFGEADDGTFYCAMERLHGRTLHQLLQRRPFSAVDALRLAERLLSALELVHAAGVVHRDLKPGNVFIATTTPGEWRPVLLDFGIAVDVSRGASPPTDRIVGTPEYMAPEQILGQPVDQRADIYGFGVLLFRTVTGELPFQAENRHDIYRAHLDAPTPRLSDVLGEEVPFALEIAVARCLAKSPGDRWQSAAELRTALDRVRPEHAGGRVNPTTQRLVFPERATATRTVRRIRPLPPRHLAPTMPQRPQQR